ncbi:MAG TPA: 3-dehydroquinate synthase [Bacteroidia bacterium]|nr:3-dehydroquinate synthase [Bacteroidia bacterium]
MMDSVWVKSEGYDICIGERAAEELDVFLSRPEYARSSLFVLVDENSLSKCMPVLSGRVTRLAMAKVIEIESGESSKNIEVCSRLWKALGEMGADRNSLLINLGGGVICDMGGFVASTFKRGIPFIQVPTTLLSQVDASVGGKVGVDLDHLKNEIGVFSKPEGVFIYPGFLKTLSRREMISGFAEVIKHALIADHEYWNFVKQANVADGAVWPKMIEHSIRIKNEVVMADPREKGLRKALNFGHTIGHAVESYFLESPGKSLLHGEAIAIGMIAESYISSISNKFGKADLDQVSAFLIRHFGHVEIDVLADHRLIELMRHDKKNTKGELNFTLLRQIGVCDVNKVADASLVKEALAYYRSLG